MTESTVCLKLERLTKVYGAVRAIDGIDLEIRRGEFVTLLGPSGSGKSTTLLLIAGFESPTSGEVYLDNRPLSRVPPHRRRIGIVFQSYALFPHLTVFENIAFALRNLHWADPEVQERVAELLSLVQLEGLGGRFPSQLSGGQQQRVALARALAFHPSILLLDEPIGALDKKLREQMLLEFRRIHRTLGTTMVYVTHDQEEAFVMSDRVAIMDRGRIVRVGTPQELYEDPVDAFVADFLGETNVLSGITRGANTIAVDQSEWMIGVSRNMPKDVSLRVAVRPEKIVIGLAPEGWNTTVGRVEEVIYLGEATKYRVKTKSGHMLLVKQVNRQQTLVYNAGADVTLTWHPADTHILSQSP